MIRLVSPAIPDDDLRAVEAVLKSGWLVQGEQVAGFEEDVAAFLGVDHAVAVSSGTAALHATVRALGIGEGDAVAVAAYSHVASANAIELCGAEPVFVDIEPATFNMDPAALERRLADAPSAEKIKAVMVVHTFGQMADVDAIAAVAGARDLALIEDAACALGAAWNGRQPAGVGAAACFSFHPRKAITTGEGGLVATSDERLADAARAFRNHGQEPGSMPPDFTAPGLNYRITEFQAVLGRRALTRLPAAIDRRRRIADGYDRLLAGMVSVPAVPAGSEHAYQSYVVLLPTDKASGRSELIRRMADAGVEATIGTWNVPTTTYYRERYGFDESSFPVTSDVFRRSLALPMDEKLTDEEVETVASALRDALGAL